MSKTSNDPASVKLEPTGHREPPSPQHEEQHTKSFPAQDANANKAFYARPKGQPNVFSKPLRTYLPPVSLNNPCKHAFDAAMFQKARR